MHTVMVTDVLDGNTLAVWPPWDLSGQKGNLVSIHGLAAPPLNHDLGDLARRKLMFLVIGTPVQIMSIQGLTDNTLLCDVFYSGRTVIDHLPEYAARPAPARENPDTVPSALVLNLGE
ncbi:MAG: hypothetical protein IT364_22965 [Candidatus Hydrogenedentes bacterium]|nr:hypothetical protein [Candidatus Hydrogenedentota bacterium]